MNMLRYAFNEIRLHRVSTSALDYNGASLHFMEKSGFQRKGIIRNAVYKDGTFHDVILLGCLKSDYEKVVEDPDYWNK